MMMKKVIKKSIRYFGFALFISVGSCSSSDDGAIDDQKNGNGNGNDNNNPTNASYWPHAVGNKWFFKNVNDADDVYEHHLYKTVNYEGKTYFQVEPLNAPEDFELTGGTREENGVFYELHGATSQMGVHTSAGSIKSMNTLLNVGETWTDHLTLTISGAASGTIQHTNEGKIVEKAASVTINGQTFQDVLKIELKKTVLNSIGSNSFTIKYEDWLAKGVGPIYRKTTYYYGSTEEVEQYNLTHYTLN